MSLHILPMARLIHLNIIFLAFTLYIVLLKINNFQYKALIKKPFSVVLKGLIFLSKNALIHFALLFTVRVYSNNM
jgi:hypothetical protein